MIEDIKNISNIIFFAVISIVTILSYLQARKTLFAPIRTETFKMQLKAFEEVLQYFQNKSESDLLDAFDLDRILRLNTLRMADLYVDMFFPNEIKIDDAERDKTYSVLVGGIVSIEHAQKFFEKVEPTSNHKDKHPTDDKISNPTIILAKWQKYEHEMIEYTKEFMDQIKELDRMPASPILPKQLRDHIIDFRSIAHECLTTIGLTITEASKKMPEHYPRSTDLITFSPTWIWNEFNESREKFEPTAKKILEHINSYLKVEDLMK